MQRDIKSNVGNPMHALKRKKSEVLGPWLAPLVGALFAKPDNLNPIPGFNHLMMKGEN